MAILQGTRFNCIYSIDNKFKLCTEYEEYVISHTDLMSILRSCAYKESELDYNGMTFVEPVLLHPMIASGDNNADEMDDGFELSEPEYDEDREER